MPNLGHGATFRLPTVRALGACVLSVEGRVTKFLAVMRHRRRFTFAGSEG